MKIIIVMIAQNRDFSNTIWYTDERFLPCKYRILGRFAHRSFLSPFPSGDSRLCVCKDPRSFVLMPIFERQENTIRKGKAAAALFLAVLCLALLTGCAKKPTKEEQEYEAAMHRFFDTMLEYDALLSGIDPAAPDATEALLTTIDDIEKACVEAASLKAPKAYAPVGEAAVRLSGHIRLAGQHYHNAFSGESFYEPSYEAGNEEYAAAGTELQEMLRLMQEAEQ